MDGTAAGATATEGFYLGKYATAADAGSHRGHITLALGCQGVIARIKCLTHGQPQSWIGQCSGPSTNELSSRTDRSVREWIQFLDRPVASRTVVLINLTIFLLI